MWCQYMSNCRCRCCSISFQQSLVQQLCLVRLPWRKERKYSEGGLRFRAECILQQACSWLPQEENDAPSAFRSWSQWQFVLTAYLSLALGWSCTQKRYVTSVTSLRDISCTIAFVIYLVDVQIARLPFVALGEVALYCVNSGGLSYFARWQRRWQAR